MDSVSYNPHEQWKKFNLRVIRHPMLRRFKNRSKRLRALEVISLSCDWGNLGVIRLMDDEIAQELDFARLEEWIAFRDQLLGAAILREFFTEGDVRVYEVNPALLVKQVDDQRDASAFAAGAWDDAAVPSDVENNVVAGDDDLLPAWLSAEQRKRYLGAARKGFFMACRKARVAGEQEPDRALFVQAYFQSRLEREGLIPSETGNAGLEILVTPEGNGNAAQTTYIENEIENNNRQNTSGNAVTLNDSVTAFDVTPVVVFDASQDSESVVQRLVELGMTEAQIHDKCIPAAGIEECARQALYYPFQPNVGNHENPGGFLYAAILGRYAAPPAYLKHVASERQAKERQARAASAAQRQAEEDRRSDKESKIADVYWNGLTDDEKRAIHLEAQEILKSDNLPLYQRFIKAGGVYETAGILVKQPLDEIRKKIVLKRAQNLQS